MPKLKPELQFELTPEQYELALPLLERLTLSRQRFSVWREIL